MVISTLHFEFFFFFIKQLRHEKLVDLKFLMAGILVSFLFFNTILCQKIFFNRENNFAQ